MSDREAMKLALEALEWAWGGEPMGTKEQAAMQALRARLAAPRSEPEPVRHPGYVIGNHWFETAYERLCAGEAEDAILEDYEMVREPRLRDLRRDAEKWRRLLEGASIAADADTSTASAAVDAAMEDKT